MKVLVCGGRNYNDREHMFSILDRIHQRSGISVIIHGAARGADSLAGQWAQARNIRCDTYPADWNRDGKQAGFIRNRQMLNDSQPDAVVAFPGTAGTAHMVRIAKQAGYKVLQVAANCR